MPYQSIYDRTLVTQASTKLALLAGAVRLFAHQGYHATSIRELARCCHTRESVVMHHYGSKKGLLNAVMEHVQSYCQQHLFNPLYEQSSALEKRIKQFIYQAHQFHTTTCEGVVMLVITIELADNLPEIRSPLKNYFQKWQHALFYILVQKGYPIKQAERLSEDVMLQLHGAIALRNIKRAPYSIAKVYQWFSNL